MSRPDILRNIIPCWYELSFLKEPLSIIIRIHEDFAKNFKPIDPLFAKPFMDDYGFDGFSGGLEGNFGFNGIITRTDDAGDFREFVVKIPKVKWMTQNPCKECEGTGRQKRSGIFCGYCQGSGKQIEDNWKSAQAISASLSLLFQMIDESPEASTSALTPQLMTVRTATLRDRDSGSPIWIKYGIPFCEWLFAHQDDRIVSEVSDTMRTVYGRMIHGKQYPSLFSVYVHNGRRITLKCDGGTVFIDGMHTMKQGEGCETMCAEIDTSTMQIALLAGIATLQDLIRTWLASQT